MTAIGAISKRVHSYCCCLTAEQFMLSPSRTYRIRLRIKSMTSYLVD